MILCCYILLLVKYTIISYIVNPLFKTVELDGIVDKLGSAIILLNNSNVIRTVVKYYNKIYYGIDDARCTLV